jgi:hypothetical protein
MRILVRQLAKVGTFLVGVLLIVLGIVLGLTPVVPGFGLVFVGLPLVMSVHPRGRNLSSRWRKKLRAAGRLVRTRRGRGLLKSRLRKTRR